MIGYTIAILGLVGQLGSVVLLTIALWRQRDPSGDRGADMARKGVAVNISSVLLIAFGLVLAKLGI